ncbi:MAG: PAS domain-containing protein [Rhizomicrobium sp.]
MPDLYRRPSYKTPDISSVEVIGIDELDDPLVKLGCRYWTALRGTRRFPARAEIAPRGMLAFLRHVVLLKVIDGGVDYEYRIAGDAHVAAIGAPFQGMRLSQIEAVAPDFGRMARATYAHVVAAAEPYCVRGWMGRDVPHARFAYHESAFLPLGATEAAVDHLLIVSGYIPRAPLESTARA